MLLGVGAGIIIGASLLQLGTPTLPTKSSPPQEQTVPKPEAAEMLTQQEVEQWLQENGYAFVKQSEWEAQVKKITDLGTNNSPTTKAYIHIYPGLSVSGLQHLLVKAGVLPKENHFVRLVGEKGLTRKIQSGVFTFEGQKTEESIIAEITRP